MIDVQPGGTDCGNGCDHVDEMRTFSHGINDNHNTVFSVCFQQFRYKIDTDHIPRAVWNWKRVECAYWRLMRGFHTLIGRLNLYAHKTSIFTIPFESISSR